MFVLMYLYFFFSIAVIHSAVSLLVRVGTVDTCGKWKNEHWLNFLKYNNPLDGSKAFSKDAHRTFHIHGHFSTFLGNLLGGRGNRVVNTLLGHKRPRRT